MLPHQQVRDIVIKPVLKALNRYTPPFEELLIATMAHESLGGSYLKQIQGPALSAYQMEPSTHDSIWNTYFVQHVQLGLNVLNICGMNRRPKAERLATDLLYATCMAVALYQWRRADVPSCTDIDKIYEVYKKCWNTYAGDAHIEDFKIHYQLFLGIKAKAKKE